MSVTNDQVATLRAQLAGQTEEHRRLAQLLDPEQAKLGYAALIAAAFIIAVERHFMKDDRVAADAEVIDFIATARERSESSADAINPEIAEKMILHLLGRGSVATIDEDTKFEHQIILLAAMVGQEQYGDLELDSFLAEARSLADKILE